MGGVEIIKEKKEEIIDFCHYCGEKKGRRSKCPVCDFYRKEAAHIKSSKKLNGNEFITIPG